MGIKGLIPFLSEKVPSSISELSLECLSGESLAIDASAALYQFTIAIRDSSYFSSLVNSKGESTSHIYGLMNRCSKLLEYGIKPVFVFDSKPPELKSKTLDKRRQKREEAKTDFKKAISEGDKESAKKLVGRTVKVTKDMNDSAKKLLRLMGIPVIEALEEAEAQCAYLVTKNLCHFVASEDTDTLVFGGWFLLRNVTSSANKKIVKVDLQKVLDGLEFNFDQFVDFCILCGCDYCDTLEGVGPKTAYSLVKKYQSLEEIVRFKGGDYDEFKEAKDYFLSPKVNEYDENSVKMGTIDPEGLTEFLVQENNFSKERVEKFIEKLLKFKTKKIQTSLLSFLTNPQPTNKSKSLDEGPKQSSTEDYKVNTNPSTKGSNVYTTDTNSTKDTKGIECTATTTNNNLENKVKIENEENDTGRRDSIDDLFKEFEDETNLFEQDEFEPKSKEYNLEKQHELELNVHNRNVILIDDDDDEVLTTANSEKMNCEIGKVKEEPNKKGKFSLISIYIF
ncbi:5'-3' exonuclease, putative [Theileria annulata]|uniref:Flap endonuclease 1 n=1 Tax=Theileria annulata TaxID=5874 RepID=FEN1_THEAN|nr:5'-3' exonuclease, putative [Theileria annulata]Q4UFP0.1 RecName: Full=Flap endonuclease 1; Short=FEN-1; AltName: Full=Flap structure-specific endonuclease 1 [Theileria annulata]CAI74076.1 5'-3' exonuclease, putative [Theileria annulata]|eukprot:XP_951808.1 5'-3' exonuclease, putative [Theileria annulata]